MTKRDILKEIQSGAYRISQSRLKKLIDGDPKKFLSVSNKRTESQLLGDVVDSLLTTPLKTDSKFQFLDVPSKVRDLLNEYLQDNEYDEEKFLEFRKEHHYSNWGNEAYKEKFLKGLKINNNIVVTNDIKAKANYLFNCLVKDPIVNKLINPGKYDQVLYQKDIEFEIMGVKARVILDMIFIDHEKQVIYPIDFKVTGLPVYKACRDFRWDIQALFMYEACRTLYGGYTVNNPGFVVVNHAGEVTNFSTNRIILQASREGWRSLKKVNIGNSYFDIDAMVYPGVKELLDLYKWHVENDHWTSKKPSSKSTKLPIL